MNRSYRLVWNDATQRFIPAPEVARGRGAGHVDRHGCKFHGESHSESSQPARDHQLEVFLVNANGVLFAPGA